MRSMPKINDLTPELKAHWLLHLNVASAALPSLSSDIKKYIQGTSELPSLKHPSNIHDWLEHSEMRTEIEGRS